MISRSVSAPLRTMLVSVLGLLLSLTGAACAGGHETRTCPAKSPLIVLDRSIGGVAVKEERSDVECRLGRGRLVEAWNQKPPEPALHLEHVRYPMAGLDVWYVSRDATRPERARGRVMTVRTRSARYRTAEGVRVGSPVTKLLALPGLGCLLATCGHRLTGRQTGTVFRLDRSGGRVIWIAVSIADY